MSNAEKGFKPSEAIAYNGDLARSTYETARDAVESIVSKEWFSSRSPDVKASIAGVYIDLLSLGEHLTQISPNHEVAEELVGAGIKIFQASLGLYRANTEEDREYIRQHGSAGSSSDLETDIDRFYELPLKFFSQNK